jgi:hypothetical protein
MHPEGLQYKTDVYFATTANKILQELTSNCAVAKNIEHELLKIYALKSTAYLEDVVSKLGLFNGFRKLNQQFCGNVLPFHVLDKNYDSEGLNLQDIQILLWTIFQERDMENAKNHFLNPENFAIQILSTCILRILQQEYATAPQNEQLYSWLHKRDFNDFSEFRQILHWLHYRSYLSRNYPLRNLDELKKTMKKDQTDYGRRLVYMMESNSIFTDVCTPLSVHAIDWFKEISQNSLLLQKLKNTDFKPYSFYRIMENDKKIINLLPFDETKPMLPLARSSLQVSNRHSSTIFEPGKECIQCPLVFFDNLWHVNGFGAFYDMDKKILNGEKEKIAKKKARQNSMELNRNAFLKQSNNLPIVFFKDFNNLRNFWNKVIPNISNEKEFFTNNPLVNEQNFAIFLNKTYGAQILPKMASMIKMKGNKLYDKTDAENYGIAILTGAYPLPLEMIEYFINNNLIPDVAIVSNKGVSHAKQLVQNNMWFIVRFFQPKLFTRLLFDELPEDYE